MGDCLFLFYLLTAAVWLFRSHRAFEALRENPVVQTSLPPSTAPRVSVLLPVKNEEENLPACLHTLLNQDYPAKEIIVINDNSIDRTAELLSEFTRLYPGIVQAVNAPSQPTGWTGKNWALAHGTPFARGGWLLFTDADTRHDPRSISSAVSHAEGKDLDLLTLSPRCLVSTFWEKILQPSAMSFIGLWFPFHKVNQSSSKLVFGNGQYLLIKRSAYDAIGGHEKVKGAFLEDFALVKEAKAAGLRIECAIGTAIYGTRMYRSFLGIWEGWRRIFYHAFEKNPLRLLTKAVTVFSFSLLPFFLFPFLTQLALENPRHYGKIWGAGFPILTLILLTAWKTHTVLRAPRRYAFLHPLAGFVLTGIFLDAFWAVLRRRELRWR